MSKRLQVLLGEDELQRLKDAAKGERLSVGEWVRRVLRQALKSRTDRPLERKLRVLREAASLSYPAPGIDQMNLEIEKGYETGLP